MEDTKDLDDDKATTRQLVESFPIDLRLAGLSLEQCLAGLPPEQRLAAPSMEQILAGLSPGQRLAGLKRKERKAMRALLRARQQGQ